MRSSLIADDEKLIREGLARSIPWEALGYDKVFTASNAYEAIATLSTETITLLITDIQMPGKTGIELLEWVKTNSPETKTIIISGYDKFEYARTAIRLGVEDYILKPIKKKELTDKIASINKKLESLNLR